MLPRRTLGSTLLLAIGLCLIPMAACDEAEDTLPGATRIDFPGVSEVGFGDPSVDADAGGRIWMSYTSLGPSPRWPKNLYLNTRIAHTDDGGDAWKDDGLLNESVDIENRGTWAHETSRLFRDPYAPAGERWLLAWHHYLKVDEEPVFTRSWIALRTASAPLPLAGWSAERKLFTGSAYDRGDDSIIGPPEVHLPDVHTDLAGCAVPGEMGLLATPGALYMSVYCGTGEARNDRVVLLRRRRETGKWQYVGTLVRSDTDVRPLGSHYDTLTASDLEEVGGKYYLIVSPSTDWIYKGCLAFEIASLEDASMVRRDGRLVPALRLDEKRDGFRGACSYEASAKGGFTYMEVFNDPPALRLFMARERIP